MPKKTKGIKADAFTGKDVNLPPAGHKRTEELAKRKDELEEQAETQYADRGAIPKDCDALNPERNREIQHNIRKGYLDIGSNDPRYKTKWVNYVHQNSEKVWQAKAQGWQVATVMEFPEAKDLSREDSTIRVGDVMLLFIPIEQYQQIEQQEQMKALKQQYGIESELHDLVNRTNRAKGGDYFAASSPALGETGHVSSSTREMMTRRNAAQKSVLNHLGNKMKEGTIPGVPIK